tara:strand:+ start:92 stop:301 length:210 start_codon:yes stop_codon:yes gene_type:complete
MSNNQSLRESVSKIKELNKIDIEIDGDISEIIADPKAWGEAMANKILLQNVNRIMKARKLGEEFGKKLI